MVFLVCIGIVIFIAIIGIFFSLVWSKIVKRRQRLREFAENQFQIPNQENMMIFKNQDFQNTTGEDVISECLTCSMIKMGSSVSYGDDRCPQCGASTTKTFL